MKIKYRDFGVVTTQLVASRDFYVNHFGFTAVYEADWYIHLKNGEIELGLMVPGSQLQPQFLQTAYPGSGAWISFEVEDVDAEYQRLLAAGIAADGPPEDRPWGERNFMVQDPNGYVLNIAKAIPKDPSF